MSIEDELLRAVHENPDDDGPRLVYADWLCEQGDPRGEFIHLQFQLEARSESDADREALSTRHWDLWKEHAADWVGPLHRHLTGHEFRRGFLHDIQVNLGEFLDHGDELLDELRVDEVTIYTGGKRHRGRLPELADCPALQRIRELTIGLEPMQARNLFRDVDLPNVAGIRIIGPISLMGARAFSTARLGGLRRLNLSENWMEARGIEHVAKWPGLSQLDVLDLGSNDIRLAGLRAIGEVNLDGLHTLALQENRLDDEAVSELATWQLPSLRRLDLAMNRFGTEGAEALARAPFLHQLEELDFGMVKAVGQPAIDVLLDAGVPRSVIRTSWEKYAD